MAAKLPFELVGNLPWDCDDDLAVFATAAMSHAWAGEGPKRVVITTDLVAAFKRYMPDRKFRDWSDRQQERYADTGAIGVGMAFTGRDGQSTIVLARLDSRDATLSLFAHEYLEAATSGHANRLGFPEAVDAEASHGRALWGEYVVERTRREISDSLGWPVTSLDHGFLLSTAEDALAATEPQQGWAYALLALDFAKVSARADAGVAGEKADLERFFDLPFPLEPWHDYLVALRDIYGKPNGNLGAHDKRAFGCWARIWRSRA
jgi:hypothetical protein